jgi:hypothetical protein
VYFIIIHHTGRYFKKETKALRKSVFYVMYQTLDGKMFFIKSSDRIAILDDT